MKIETNRFARTTAQIVKPCLTLIVTMILPITLLSACASTGQPEGPATADPDTLNEQYGNGLDTQAQNGNRLSDPRALSAQEQALLQQTRLHFAFDQSGLEPEHQAILEAHAKNLLAHPDKHLMLEGHADERGTREYNLALGERRSNGVERALILLGVPARQLKATSLGEEQPAVLGQGEQSYYENRRVELKYQDKMAANSSNRTNSAY